MHTHTHTPTRRHRGGEYEKRRECEEQMKRQDTEEEDRITTDVTEHAKYVAQPTRAIIIVNVPNPGAQKQSVITPLQTVDMSTVRPTAQPLSSDYTELSRAYMASNDYPAESVWKLLSIGPFGNTCGGLREYAFFYRSAYMARVNNGISSGISTIPAPPAATAAATTPAVAMADIVTRHRAFSSATDFANAVKTQILPSRIEAGAIFLVKPHKGQPTHEACARELCFDIDIGDYGKPFSCYFGGQATLSADTSLDVCVVTGGTVTSTLAQHHSVSNATLLACPARSCSCADTHQFCSACWPLVTLAAEQIDTQLCAFGSRSHAWFFTGGRGLHCRYFGRDPTFYTPNASMRSALRMQLSSPPEQAYVIIERATSGCTRDPRATAMVRKLISPMRKNAGDGDGDGMDRPEDATAAATVVAFTTPGTAMTMERNFCDWYLRHHPSCALKAIIAVGRRHLLETKNAVSQSRTTTTTTTATTTTKTKTPVYDRATILLNELLVRCECALQYATTAEQRLNTSAALRTVGLNEWDDSALVRGNPLYNAIHMIESLCENIPDAGLTWDCALRVVAEAALLCMAPRVDTQVTDQVWHLLRVPMGVHATTGRVGVLVARAGEIAKLRVFTPTMAPKIVPIEDGRPSCLDMTTTIGTKLQRFEYDNYLHMQLAKKDFENFVEEVTSSYN
jgi:DNA primase catalytic subunit